MSDFNAQSSASDESGRVLTGVGVSAESLQEVIDARAPVDDDAPAADTAGAAPAPAAVPADASQPKQTRGQARFSELTQQRKDAEAKAEAAEKRAADLEARLNQSPAAPAPSSQAPERLIPSVQNGGDSGGQPSQPSRPEPTEDEIGPGLKYETYGAFVKDQSKWEWEQQQAAIDHRVRQGIEAHTQQQAFAAHAESVKVKGRSTYKDFDAIITNGPGNQATTFMPPPFQHFIWQQPNAEHLVYAILKDHAVAQRLAWLAVNQPAAFGLELAKIAPAAPAALPASTGNPGLATPPPPMQPVGAGSKTTGLSSADYAKNGDIEGYKRQRALERGFARRR